MNTTDEHNPDNLTPEQYGAPEWRLLKLGEPILHAYQEALDMAVYLKRAMDEIDAGRQAKLNAK